jgi:hypothetical protein
MSCRRRALPVAAISLLLAAPACGREPVQIESTGASPAPTAGPTAAPPTAGSSTTAVAGGPMGEPIAFTSPSGNIACRLDPEHGASCWVAEHDWAVEAASDPDCQLDFGDAVDVTPDGVVWPCYGDFSWFPDAPALPYGRSVSAGPFTCESAETGVTCHNGDGRGFTVARATVDTF